MHTYIPTYIHTYIHTSPSLHLWSSRTSQPLSRISSHICIHTYIPTYIHTYIHTYISFAASLVQAASVVPVGLSNWGLGPQPFRIMPVSAVRLAKHAFIVLLRSLAVIYGLAVPPLSRDSPDADVTAVFRRVSLRAHPDKGGSLQDQKRLNAARDAWQAAKKAGQGGGRPAQSAPERPSAPESASERPRTLKNAPERPRATH